MANSSLPAKSPTRSTSSGCSDLYQVSGPRGPTWSSVDDAMLMTCEKGLSGVEVAEGRLWQEREKRMGVAGCGWNVVDAGRR